jgi:hypothetical protein
MKLAHVVSAATFTLLAYIAGAESEIKLFHL